MDIIHFKDVLQETRWIYLNVRDNQGKYEGHIKTLLLQDAARSAAPADVPNSYNYPKQSERDYHHGYHSLLALLSLSKIQLYVVGYNTRIPKKKKKKRFMCASVC